MTQDRRLDLISAALFLALGLFALFVLIPQGVAVPESTEIAALLPNFWPRLIAYAAIVASVFLLIESLTMTQPAIEDDEDLGRDFQMEPIPGAINVAILLIGLFAFYASLPWLGVVLASILALIAMMLLFGERTFWLIAVLGVGVPILLYLFFRHVAGVPIPLGIFAA